MNFVILLNLKYDILKNVCKQLTVAIDFHRKKLFRSIEVNGYHQIFS